MDQEDSILSNSKKKEKYNINITWVSYDKIIFNEIKGIAGNNNKYLLLTVD